MVKKVFKQMLITQILSAMTVTLCMMIDSIMIGRFLGVHSMSAYEYSTPVLLVFAALGSMLSAGIQVACGKSMGSGDEKGANLCFSSSIIMALTISIVGLILIFTLPNPICELLGAGDAAHPSDVFGFTKKYLKGFIIGAPAFIIAQIMVPYIQMAGEQTRLIVAVIMMTISDIIFDILNVMVFKGGMFGMGLASSLSYYVAIIVALTYFVKKDCLFKFKLSYVKGEMFLNILKHGVPMVINQLSLVVLVYLFNIILSNVDIDKHTAVAAYGTISTISNICYSFGTGVATVSLTLSAMFFVDEDKSSIIKLVRIMTFYAFVLDLIVTIVTFFASPLIAGMFLKERAARNVATQGIRLFSLCLIPCSLNTTFKNFYQGINRSNYTKIISVIQNFVFPAAYAYILSRYIGATGVWVAFVCGETTALLVISCVVWVRAKRLSFKDEDYALLPEGFGVADNECFEKTIYSSEDVVKISEKAEQFLKESGEDPKIAMYIALCIEEITNNIVEYGFESNKENSVDVRYMNKDGKRTLRIRDDCKNFDPVEYRKLHKNDDLASHIGIRMVMSMVKEANYMNSLGLNNLTLVF